MADLVRVISDKLFEGEEGKVLDSFNEFQLAIIEKDSDKLDEILLENYCLIHMSGRKENKQDFIAEISDGILNYYESIINYPEIIINSNNALLIADVTLDAMVYGAKGRWTLHSKISFKKIDNQWHVSEWKN